MKKLPASGLLFAILLLMLCLIQPAQARSIYIDKENRYDLADEFFHASIRLNTGYLSGEATEILYAGTNSSVIRSQLDWDFDGVFLVGGGVSVQKEWVAIHFDGWTKVTEGDAVMDDYDWLSSPSAWSDWSHHEDTIVSKANIMDLRAEIMIPRFSSDNIVLSLLFGYKYEKYEWKARGGSYVYSTSGTLRDDVGNFDDGVPAITYDQKFQTPYLGIGARANLNKLNIAASLTGSFWSDSEALDYHHLRNESFLDEMEDGRMVSIDVTANYRFTDQWSLGLGYCYTRYDEFKGDFTHEIIDPYSKIKWNDGAGAELKTQIFSISLSYLF
jgi:plasminogen activator